MGILVASLAPIFIIALYIYVRDRYDREPVLMLVKALGGGMLAVVPILWTERFLAGFSPVQGMPGEAFYHAFVVAAATEELFKFLALFIIVWKSPSFNEQFDGIVYAVFISLGFAAVENVLYVTEGGYQTAMLRAVTAVPAHAVFGITMGYYFGIARRYAELRRSYLFRAVAVPFLLHGIYDFLLMAGQGWLLLLFIPFLLYLHREGSRKIRKLSSVSVFRPADTDEDKAAP